MLKLLLLVNNEWCVHQVQVVLIMYALVWEPYVFNKYAYKYIVNLHV